MLVRDDGLPLDITRGRYDRRATPLTRVCAWLVSFFHTTGVPSVMVVRTGSKPVGVMETVADADAGLEFEEK